jgi:predicted DNA-binding WGR domain protein
VAPFYSLMIERDLFGTIRLVRAWGRIGTNRQELVKIIRYRRRKSLK